jgi:hypothetical protein
MLQQFAAEELTAQSAKPEQFVDLTFIKNSTTPAF